jgi:hypothetical protein
MMTRDEILNMPAGRELDSIIADCIFGIETVKPKSRTDYVEDIHARPKGSSAKWIDCEVLKFYSSNMDAAWEVFEFVSKSSEETSLSRNAVENISIGHDSDGWMCSIWWFRDIQSSHAVEGIYADTAPLAICRAALLAILNP